MALLRTGRPPCVGAGRTGHAFPAEGESGEVRKGDAGGGAKRLARLTSPAAARLVLVLVLALLSVASGLPGQARRARAGSLSGWKFCVDAGHGGAESGAVGPTGLLEKDVNLVVARKLRDLLVAEGAEVLMTREDDSTVSITQRWQMANAWEADRFISIHHNAMENAPSVNGTETLVYTYAGQESLELANSVQAELVAEFGLPNRGIVRRSDVGVLKNTNMPAILTEASFISNPEQERLLRDEAYLAREAAAIMRGIRLPSSVTFIYPRRNRVSFGEVQVSLQLLGNDSIERVDLYLEDKLLFSRSAAPYDFLLDTSQMEDGTHALKALVRYAGGGTASASRDLIVANDARNWYFAEGTTRRGFEEWLTVLNPNLQEAEISVTYAFDNGQTLQRDYRVAEESRLSIDVNREVGPDRDLSLMVSSTLPVVVERPMYFLYKGSWDGGHVSGGTTSPSETWFFAEGYTGPGFEEWLCLLNPQDQPAVARVEYLSQEGLLLLDELVLPPRRRVTVDVNRRVGPDREVSMRVTADRPIVAERPVYFLYHGRYAGGHVACGAAQAASRWYFAEGYTGPGFEEWLCLLNPQPEPNLVRITYQTSDGKNLQDEELVPPHSRRTVDVNLRAGRDLQLSVVVEGEKPLVAERVIYHDYHQWCRGGDVVTGVRETSRHWYFAEGYTGPGFEDWLCLQNPGGEDVEAEITLHFESGEVLQEKVRLPGRSRTTLYLNSMSPYQEGMAISVHASGGITAERPVYFRYRGAWAGEHTSAGYSPDQ